METSRSAGVRKANCVEILVEDEGPGDYESGQSLRSVFTTKPDGSGIGLPLSRQIAEAHDGTLALMNRDRPAGRTSFAAPAA